MVVNKEDRKLVERRALVMPKITDCSPNLTERQLLKLSTNHKMTKIILKNPKHGIDSVARQAIEWLSVVFLRNAAARK